MFANLRVTQKALILVSVPVVSILISVGIFVSQVSSTLRSLEQLDRQQQALMALNSIGSTVSTGAILAIGSQNDTPEFRNCLTKLETVLELSQSLANNEYPELREPVNQAAMMQTSIMRMTKTKEDIDRERNAETREARKFSRKAVLLSLIEFSSLARKMVDYENSINVRKPKISTFWGGAPSVALLSGVLFAGLAFALQQMFTSDILSRLRVISFNCRRLATGDTLARPLGGSDEIANLDRVIHDVSASLSDARLQSLSILDNASDVICSLDGKFKFTAVNPASMTLWKYAPEELLGMSLIALLASTADAEDVRAAFRKIADIDGGGNLETTIKCKDGSHRDFRWTVSWSEREHSFSCVVHDISQLKEIEKLKQQFMLMVSHDLRSPLTSLTMSFSMHLDGVHGDITDKQRAALTRAQASLQRLIELINDLLDLGKLESGQLTVQAQRVRAFNVCMEAIEALEPMAKQAGVKLERPRGDGVMSGEERRLLQATINLLSNSIKFSPGGSAVKLDIENSGGFVEIRVTDSGPGIPLEDRALIFEKFRQSAAQSNIDIKGSGLGLAIVKAIVTAHGGSVGLSSQLGKGSTFWFRIPKFDGAARADEGDGDLL